jgi:hypothetical protein
MVKVTILFHGCRQNEQDIGTPDEFMQSRVLYSVQSPNKRYDGLSVFIKQVAGDKYETGGIEVDSPNGYGGLMNYSAFRDAVEGYYRSLIGSTGSAIRIEGGASNLVMRNNMLMREDAVEIEIDVPEGSW